MFGSVCLRENDKTVKGNLADLIAGMRHHFQTGKSRENGWEYDITGMGFNRPMTDIDAAIGLAQLDRFGEIEAKRIEITEFYDGAFRDDDRIDPLINHFEPGIRSAYHLYPVSVCSEHKGSSEGFRNHVILAMREVGVPCNVHYKPLPMMTAYRNLGYRIEDYPQAYWRYMSLLTLPYHTLLDQNQLGFIADSLKKAVRS